MESANSVLKLEKRHNTNILWGRYTVDGFRCLKIANSCAWTARSRNQVSVLDRTTAMCDVTII